jgi:prevent-host-death family protein
MAPINLAQAKAHLSELVREAQNGEEIIIMRRVEPVAKLVPITRPNQRLRSPSEFRATLPRARTFSAGLVRKLRDEGH